MIWGIQNHLVEGDAMHPARTDIVAQTGRLKVGKRVPDGWRVLTGNQSDSFVGRVAFRFEIEEESI